MKKQTILIIVLAILLSGFVFAFLLNTIAPLRTACTLKACICENHQDRTEVPCNTCSTNQYNYALFILNIGRQCNAQEIVICENGAHVDRKLENFTNCEAFVSFFGNQIK